MSRPDVFDVAVLRDLLGVCERQRLETTTAEQWRDLHIGTDAAVRLMYHMNYHREQYADFPAYEELWQGLMKFTEEAVKLMKRYDELKKRREPPEKT